MPDPADTAARAATVQELNARYRGVKAAVLGASGFIGRWVARRLTAAGAQPYLVVREPGPAAQLVQDYGLGGMLVPTDLSSHDAVSKLLEELRPAVVFNLAGYGVDRSERDEAQAYTINADLIDWLCSAMSRRPERGWSGLDLVHIGSALEYGELEGDLAEDSIPNPTTVYGKSKLAGTRKLAHGCDRFGLHGLTARLFTIYGPGEHEGRLVPSLLEVSRTREKLPMTAGTQRRDFTYVEDVAEGLLRLGIAQANPGEIVNLATGKLTSVRNFASIAGRTLDIPGDRMAFGALPTRREEMQHDPVNIGRLTALTGWRPETTIEEGMLQTRAFIDNFPQPSD